MTFSAHFYDIYETLNTFSAHFYELASFFMSTSTSLSDFLINFSCALLRVSKNVFPYKN